MNSSLFSFKEVKITKALEAEWKCPSNIALVKYWGKKQNQIPCNASLSLTLKEAYTQSRIKASFAASSSVQFYLEEERNVKFEERITKYIQNIADYLPFLKNCALEIHSSNSFPHSSGIASSASGFGALALGLLDIQYQLDNKKLDDTYYRQASYLARLGSGSACRSVYGGITVWGEHHKVSDSSNEYAVQLSTPKALEGFRDYILLVETGSKKVSSSVGHGLMDGHPFAEARFNQASTNLSKMLLALASENVSQIGLLSELEALTLHAMMMSSTPHFMLFKPNSIAIIEEITQFREQTGEEIYFTLDAGANVHVLCSNKSAKACEELIKTTLIAYCENEKYICDQLGDGPERLTSSL